MAHARVHLQAMLAWIEETIAAGEPAATDAAICERFGFASPEQARTLLAELADAGRITIRGWGADREIALGRARSAPIAAGRPTPTVQRADPVFDAGMAKIAAILARGRKAPPAPPAPAPIITSEEEEGMATAKATSTARTISVPAKDAVLAAIEDRAQQRDIALGQAAVTLIEDAIAAREEALMYDAADVADAEPALTLAVFPTRDLLEELGARLESGVPAIERDAAIARAEAAEGQVATMRAQARLMLGTAA